MARKHCHFDNLSWLITGVPNDRFLGNEGSEQIYPRKRSSDAAVINSIASDHAIRRKLCTKIKHIKIKIHKRAFIQKNTWIQLSSKSSGEQPIIGPLLFQLRVKLSLAKQKVRKRPTCTDWNTDGRVNFCWCEETNCFPEILSTDEYSKTFLFFFRYSKV